MIYPRLSDGTIDWCAMCKHEGNDFYDLCCECEYPETPDDPPTKYEPKPITNADRVRSMSNEELAEFLSVQMLAEVVHGWKRWLDWLKQGARS